MNESREPLALAPQPRRLPAVRNREAVHRAALRELVKMLIDGAASSARPLMLTVNEAMEYTGLSRAFLMNLVDAGKLTLVEDGVLKVRRSDLDEFISSPDMAAWYTEQAPKENTGPRPTPPRAPSGRFLSVAGKPEQAATMPIVGSRVPPAPGTAQD